MFLFMIQECFRFEIHSVIKLLIIMTNVTPSYFIVTLVLTIVALIEMDSAIECAGETPPRSYAILVLLFGSRREKC